MTPNENMNARPEPPSPICPHCGRGAKNKEACTLSGHGIMMGGFPWIVVTCSGCHKIITVQPMPMVPEMQLPQQPRKSPLAI